MKKKAKEYPEFPTWAGSSDCLEDSRTRFVAILCDLIRYADHVLAARDSVPTRASAEGQFPVDVRAGLQRGFLRAFSDTASWWSACKDEFIVPHEPPGGSTFFHWPSDKRFSAETPFDVVYRLGSSWFEDPRRSKAAKSGLRAWGRTAEYLLQEVGSISDEDCDELELRVNSQMGIRIVKARPFYPPWVYKQDGLGSQAASRSQRPRVTARRRPSELQDDWIAAKEAEEKYDIPSSTLHDWKNSELKNHHRRDEESNVILFCVSALERLLRAKGRSVE